MFSWLHFQVGEGTQFLFLMYLNWSVSTSWVTFLNYDQRAPSHGILPLDITHFSLSSHSIACPFQRDIYLFLIMGINSWYICYRLSEEVWMWDRALMYPLTAAINHPVFRLYHGEHSTIFWHDSKTWNSDVYFLPNTDTPNLFLGHLRGSWLPSPAILWDPGPSVCCCGADFHCWLIVFLALVGDIDPFPVFKIHFPTHSP